MLVVDAEGQPIRSPRLHYKDAEGRNVFLIPTDLPPQADKPKAKSLKRPPEDKKLRPEEDK